jgi:ubiquitin C-terminal hydrolase
MYKNSQEDYVEFIRVFLNDLSIENNINISNKSYKELSYEGKKKYEASKEFHNNYIRRENSAVIKNFYFQMMNIYVCSCGYETFSFDKYLDLPLLIPDQQKNYKLIDLIKYRLNSKLNEWSQKCENCKLAGLNHNRFEKFDMISNYIIIYIQRINKFEKTKNNSIIEFEENLNLGEFFVEKNISKNCLFKLLCIIYHEGSLDCGHYYVIIKIRDKWFKFSDDKVKLLNTIQFKSKDVCAFVYEK